MSEDFGAFVLRRLPNGDFVVVDRGHKNMMRPDLDLVPHSKLR